jgi:hypothetical protein
MKSVYSAVRTESLNKAVCPSSLEGSSSICFVLEMKNKTYKKAYLECCSLWTLRKIEERVVKAFGTRSWRRMLKI